MSKQTETRGGSNRDSLDSSGNIRYLHNYSTLPSRITFYWFTGLLRLGYWHPLEEEDLGELPEEEKTSTQLNRFQIFYELEKVRIYRDNSGDMCVFIS